MGVGCGRADWEKGKTGGGIGQAQGRARATLGSDLDQMMGFSPFVDGSPELDIVAAVESGATQGRLGGWGRMARGWLRRSRAMLKSTSDGNGDEGK